LITRRHIRVLLKAAGFSVVLDAASIQSSVKTPYDIALTLQFHEKKHPKNIVKMRNNRAAEDIIDAQNRERQERLASKSSFLKSLAFDIESEAKDHNRLLDNVDGDFDSTGNFLSGTLNRVTNMLGSGRKDRKIMCYIAGGVVVFITLIYMLSSKLRSAD